jgi:hypothetical protein
VRRKLEGVDVALADLARQANASLPEFLTAFAEEATIDVRKQWPSKTGRSKEALHVEAGPPVSIVCDVRYAGNIHEKGLVGPTWYVRIVEYIRANAGSIGDRAVARIRAVP